VRVHTTAQHSIALLSHLDLEIAELVCLGVDEVFDLGIAADLSVAHFETSTGVPLPARKQWVRTQ
jgi:hypothetical protein